MQTAIHLLLTYLLTDIATSAKRRRVLLFSCAKIEYLKNVRVFQSLGYAFSHLAIYACTFEPYCEQQSHYNSVFRTKRASFADSRKCMRDQLTLGSTCSRQFGGGFKHAFVLLESRRNSRMTIAESTHLRQLCRLRVERLYLTVHTMQPLFIRTRAFRSAHTI